MARLITHRNGKKTVFIHAAKTGGTFFREQLNKYGVKNEEIGEKHDDYKRVMALLDVDVNMFGFIRHPFSWYVSRWAYAKMTYFYQKLQAFPIEHPIHKHWMADTWNDNLNTFIDTTTQLYPDGVCTEYFNKMFGDVVDVHRYEDIKTSTGHLLQSFGIAELFEITMMNMNSAKPILSSDSVPKNITLESKRKIMRAEERFIENYYPGYEQV